MIANKIELRGGTIELLKVVNHTNKRYTAIIRSDVLREPVMADIIIDRHQISLRPEMFYGVDELMAACLLVRNNADTITHFVKR